MKKLKIAWIKLRNWEYWPFNLVYFPIAFYYIWLSIKARSLFFFSASNPGIEFAGMLGESKIVIYKGIAHEYIPRTMFYGADENRNSFSQFVKDNNFNYPYVLKPDRGERGWMVEVIRNEVDLEKYMKRIKVDFLIQEFVDLPMEMAIFYYRHPKDKKGTVSSIAVKEFFFIEGDGLSTISELIEKNDRGRVFLRELLEQSEQGGDQVLEIGKRVKIGEIGNHCKGTMFKNGNHLITESLNEVIDKISQSIPGFYFGRLDIRCTNMPELLSGKFKIIELNGAGSEPAHIFDPKYKLFDAYKDISFHLKKMFEISHYNRKLGIHYMSFSEYKRMRGIIKRNKALKAN